MLRILLATMVLSGCDPFCEECETGDPFGETGLVCEDEWKLLGSTLAIEDMGIPLDAIVALHVGGSPLCEEPTWRLADEGGAEVGTGGLEEALGLGVRLVRLPALSPGAAYTLEVSGVDYDPWSFTSAYDATSVHDLAPTITQVELTAFVSNTGEDRLTVDVMVTTAANLEVSHPAVQVDSSSGDTTEDLVWIAGDDGSIRAAAGWADTGEGSRCVRARQLAADGTWGPWSEEVCAKPERPRRIWWGCTTSPLPLSVLTFLGLPWLIRRRRQGP